jgi:type IV secretion system protein VirD4
MSELIGDFLEMAWRASKWLARELLPSWFTSSTLPHSHGTSRWARAREHDALGRALAPARAVGDGLTVGFLGRRLLQTPAEDNLLVLGVQRSGKTSTVVLPTLLTWSGAAVATSTKEELVRHTAQARQRRGPVFAFSPLDRDHSWMEALGLSPATWNPLHAAEDCGAAAELADCFTSEGKRGRSAHWYLSAGNLITALAVLEHQQGGDMRSLLRRLNRGAQSEYVSYAASVADAMAADMLLAFAHTPDDEAGSVASTARSSLSLWVDDRIASATSNSENQVDLDRLLAEGGILYLVAPAEEAERCRPLFSALLQDLLRRATRKARTQGGVLAPRLLLALDEAGNFARIPRLAGYCSSGPGQGIQLLLCFHDLAQIEAGYGAEEARTIWNNCRARLLLPGQGDLRTLEQFSRAIGDETRIYRTRNSERGSVEQRIGRPLASPDELRRQRNAVFVYATAPPALITPRRWDQVPHFRRLAEGGAPAGASGHPSSLLSTLFRRLSGKGVAS